jgi:hypothetical protein
MRGEHTLSRDYRPTRPIPAAYLFGGRLEKYGVREKIVEGQDVHDWAAEMGVTLPAGAGGKLPGTTETSRCLTDGSNYAWVEISKRGFVAMVTFYGLNDCDGILRAMAREFDTEIIDEEHPEFWEGHEGEVIGIPLSEFEVIKGPSIN